MMYSNFGTYMEGGALPASYYDGFVDNNYNMQMAMPQLARRLSRGSTGQRVGTSSMRVVKPSSTSNSPRSSAALRRRTMMNDTQTTRRHQQVMEYLSTTPSTDATRATRQQSRPVSWHPSTHLQPPQPPLYHQQAFNLATSPLYNQQDLYSAPSHYSPMMTSYSNNTSPSSTFSPLPASYQGMEQMTGLPADSWQASEKSLSYFPALNDNSLFVDSSLNNDAQKVSNNSLDWNSFILHGFNNTSPPTPDSFVQATAHLQTAVPEAGIQAIDEPEEEGEILVGMGLYDTPDKCEEDPHLNNYRSTVSSLLGSSFRAPEPQGKGLKLEETWEPPKSDDEGEEEEEEEEEEERADGDTEEWSEDN